MTIALIIICAVFMVGVVLAVVGYIAFGITRDRNWRTRMNRYYENRHADRPT